MTKLFPAKTRLEAWIAATEHVLKKGPHLNIILEVSSPGVEGPQSIREALDAFYRDEGQLPLHSVAETIFPGWEYRRRGLRGLVDYYAQEFDALKEPHQWGTYAERLLRRKSADGEVVSPLGTLIEKMRSERGLKGTKRACYELGLADPAYDVPLYDSTKDQSRRRGLPCLSHLSFKLVDDVVHLTALYRSHDYRYKVPGNLLGLARLQACVAHEVGGELGTLVMHSTYAWAQGSKAKLRQLISQLKADVNA